MGKKLITVGNYRECISDDKLCMKNDYIITAGAKDALRREGIQLIYGEAISNGRIG